MSEISISHFLNSDANELTTAMNYHSRGLAHKRKQQYARAIRDFNEAIKLDEKFTIAYQERGRTFLIKLLHGRAILDFRKVIELNPENPWALNSLA